MYRRRTGHSNHGNSGSNQHYGRSNGSSRNDSYSGGDVRRRNNGSNSNNNGFSRPPAHNNQTQRWRDNTNNQNANNNYQNNYNNYNNYNNQNRYENSNYNNYNSNNNQNRYERHHSNYNRNSNRSNSNYSRHHNNTQQRRSQQSQRSNYYQPRNESQYQPTSVSIEFKQVTQLNDDSVAIPTPQKTIAPALEALINCNCINLVQNIEKDPKNNVLFDIVYENIHITRVERDRLKKAPKQIKDKLKEMGNDVRNRINRNNNNGYRFKYHPEFYKQRICGVAGLPLAIAMSMKEVDLKLLSRFDYYVTEKSDGLRMLFIADNITKSCYFMDRKMTFYRIDHPFYKSLLSDKGATVLDGELILIEPESTDSKTDESDSCSKIIYYNIFDCVSHCGDYFAQESTNIRFQQIDMFVDFFNQQYTSFSTQNLNTNRQQEASTTEVQGSTDPSATQPSNHFQPTLPVEFGAKLQVPANEIKTILDCIEFDCNRNEYIFTHPTTNKKSLNDGLIFTPKYAAYLMRKDYWSKWSSCMHSDAKQYQLDDKKMQRSIDKYDFASYKASKDILKWKPMELRTVDFLVQTPLDNNIYNSLMMNIMNKTDNNNNNNNNNNNSNEEKDEMKEDNSDEKVERVEIELYCEGKRNRKDGKVDTIISVNGKEMTRYGKCFLKNRKDISMFLEFYNESKEMEKIYSNDGKTFKWILECKWDKNNKHWIICRNRLDKIHANYIDTCDRTFEIMMAGIDRNDLIKMCEKTQVK